LASMLFVLLMALVLGLVVGVTAELNRWGQLVLMVGMFVGRIGSLLLLSAIFGSHPTSRISYQQGELYL
ncbi:MAG: potassium transporter TrkG, partial [Cyanobacteria bacterium]|nr:potassium transporter TrkG [Cyanobacteriota bacterium]